eukprot:PhM_4_TR13500/c0_g1_i1/m.24432
MNGTSAPTNAASQSTTMVSPGGSYGAIVHGPTRDRITIVSLKKRTWAPSCGIVKAATWRTDSSLVVCGSDGVVRSLDVSAGPTSQWQEVVRLESPVHIISHKGMTSQAHAFAAWDGSRILYVDPLVSMCSVVTTDTFSDVTCVALSPNTRVVAVGTPTGLYIVRTVKGKTYPIPQLAGHITAVSFNGSKSVVVVCDATLYVVSLSDNSTVQSWPLMASPVGLSMDSSTACVATCDANGASSAEMFDISTGSAVASVPLTGTVAAVTLMDRTITTAAVGSGAVVQVACDAKWSVVSSSSHVDDRGLAHILGNDGDIRPVVMDHSLLMADMVDIVRHFPYTLCLTLAKKCSQTVAGNPDHWARCAMWCSAILSAHPKSALKNSTATRHAMAAVVGVADIHTNDNTGTMCRRIDGYLDVLSVSAPPSAPGDTLTSFLEQELRK